MSNGKRTTLALALLALVTACSDGRSPTLSTSLQSPTSPTPPTTGVQPVVTGIIPSIGSDRGGGWGTITGTDFAVGAILTLGGSGIRTFFQDSTTIRFSGIPAHATGTVDVVVTNPGGLSSMLSRGYMFASPSSFDFSGDWTAHAGPEYESDMRFTVRQNQLVGLSCAGVAVALSAPVNAVGTIDVPACSGRWWADKPHD